MIQQKCLAPLAPFPREGAGRSASPKLLEPGVVMFWAETCSILHLSLSSVVLKNLSYEATIPSECDRNSCAGKDSACALRGHCLQPKSCRHTGETSPRCTKGHSTCWGQLVSLRAAVEWPGEGGEVALNSFKEHHVHPSRTA